MTVSRGLTVKQQRFVDALPTSASQTEAALKAGYAPHSAAESASEALRNSKVVAALEDKKRAIKKRVEAAQTHFIEHSLEIAATMTDRALGSGRDSQRAGERILEQVGILDKVSMAVASDPSLDVLAKLTAMMALQLQAQADNPGERGPSIREEVVWVLGVSGE